MTAFITHAWQSLKTLCCLVILLSASVSAVAAESSMSSRLAGLEIQEGALVAHSRFSVVLPSAVSDALEQGVTLSFKLEFELTRPRAYALWRSVTGLFEPVAFLHYKLSYHSLTRQYRVSTGTLYQNYPTLQEALAAVGAIRGWRVLPKEAISQAKVSDFAGRLRLSLDRTQLPRPFQLNTFNSSEWALDSGWIAVTGSEGEH